MPLGPPPDDSDALSGFPRVSPRFDASVPLYRIFRHRDPGTGQPREPFWFSSAEADDPGGNRYDLPPPHGVCYLARSAIGAFLEVFRSPGLVATDDLRARRLCRTRIPRPLRLADLLSRRARGFGVTGEIHTCADYRLPRLWADALRRSGFRGLRGKVRHDPPLREQSVSLFDRGGAHAPFGWRWWTEVTRIEADTELLLTAARYGYRVARIPYEVDAD